MTNGFFINRVKHCNFIDYYMCLNSVYVLLLAIRERAIKYLYVTEQNVYIDLLITIESRIGYHDIFSVLE